MRIEVDGLHYFAGKKHILNGVSAVFEGRKIYGVIGPNGCGKTTLLRHLYRQYPARGHVTADGVPLDAFPGRDYARRVAVMMQSYPEADLRVWEVVMTGRYPYKRIMLPYGQEDEAVVEAILRHMRLWELRGRRIHTLSGGERQRVMIARCLAQQPEVIILDEPTNHLDIRYRLELMDALREFDGMVVMTLHELNLAARYCDYIYAMKDGRMVASGIPETVLRSEILNPVFETSIRAFSHEGEIFINV